MKGSIAEMYLEEDSRHGLMMVVEGGGCERYEKIVDRADEVDGLD